MREDSHNVQRADRSIAIFGGESRRPSAEVVIPTSGISEPSAVNSATFIIVCHSLQLWIWVTGRVGKVEVWKILVPMQRFLRWLLSARVRVTKYLPRPAGGGGGGKGPPCGFSQIAPEVLGISLWNKICFPRQFFQGFQMPLEFLESVQWFRRSEGGGGSK